MEANGKRKAPSMSNREPCAFCGDEDWTEAHFALGRIICKLCYVGGKPALVTEHMGTFR
jgi:hypothetical protein